jgi:DNA invertase Pin-like site-specific DNA recombinase
MPFVVTKTTVKATKIPTSSVDLGMDIAIYSRTSTAKQNNENQLGQLRAIAHTQRWNIKGENIDIASGKNGDREQFKALFDAASRREFELVLFWSLDRFSREGVFETLQYLQRLKAYGMGLDRY